jgi:CDP-diacylglycerol---serine O-phosphatidyltransferase
MSSHNMVRQLMDPANAITATGIVISVIGIRIAMAGQPEWAVAVVLWALLADHLDGVVAVRTPGRLPETGRVGKNLDSLADLISAGIFPAIVALQVSGNSWPALLCAGALVVASALRLAYFNVVGLSGGRFIGVPTTYALPVLALLFLLRPWVPADAFSGVLCGALLLLAVLHVTPIAVPPTRGLMYAVVTAFAVTSSVVLALRVS